MGTPPATDGGESGKRCWSACTSPGDTSSRLATLRRGGAALLLESSDVSPPAREAWSAAEGSTSSGIDRQPSSPRRRRITSASSPSAGAGVAVSLGGGTATSSSGGGSTSASHPPPRRRRRMGIDTPPLRSLQPLPAREARAAPEGAAMSGSELRNVRAASSTELRLSCRRSTVGSHTSGGGRPPLSVARSAPALACTARWRGARDA